MCGKLSKRNRTTTDNTWPKLDSVFEHLDNLSSTTYTKYIVLCDTFSKQWRHLWRKGLGLPDQLENVNEATRKLNHTWRQDLCVLQYDLLSHSSLQYSQFFMQLFLRDAAEVCNTDLAIFFRQLFSSFSISYNSSCRNRDCTDEIVIIRVSLS